MRSSVDIFNRAIADHKRRWYKIVHGTTLRRVESDTFRLGFTECTGNAVLFSETIRDTQHMCLMARAVGASSTTSSAYAKAPTNLFRIKQPTRAFFNPSIKRPNKRKTKRS
jgi:hypothetical protein